MENSKCFILMQSDSTFYVRGRTPYGYVQVSGSKENALQFQTTVEALQFVRGLQSGIGTCPLKLMRMHVETVPASVKYVVEEVI